VPAAPPKTRPHPRARARARAVAAAGLAAAALAATGCGDSNPDITIGPPPRLVTFGHSFVQGLVPDKTVTPWPDQVAAKLGWKLENNAVSGTDSAVAAAAVARYTPQPSDVVVIESILNDVGYQGRAGLPRYERNLRAMLRRLTRGPSGPARILVLGDPPVSGWNLYRPVPRGSNAILRTYVTQTQRIAREFPKVDFADLGAGWSRRTDESPIDHLHPSAAGTRTIRDRVLTLLRRTTTTKDAR
jgi:lysophospholipase L1-like esterase